MKKNSKIRTRGGKTLSLLFFLFILLGVGTSFNFAITSTPIKTGLSAAVGVALDSVHNHLYFVEYNAGTLKRINLADTAYPTITVASGFTHPEDVALDIDRSLAYVTTRNNPGTGGLYKVDIAAGSSTFGNATLLTFNLGAPQQLALDLVNSFAYTVGYNDGRLRRIDLTNGVKTPIITGLNNPVGIVITKDAKYAYVTEQGLSRVVKIDLTLGSMVGIAASGFTDPFFLSWTDSSENSLYVAERNPVNKVSRIDLTTAAAPYEAIPASNLDMNPSGITVNGMGTPVYVTTDSKIFKVDLIELTGPVFMAVGHVPVTGITAEGYADTSSITGYFFQVKHCPFGGTVNIFGNFTNFKTSIPAAKYYAVVITKDSSSSYFQNSWTVNRWDSTEMEYKPFTITPALDGFKYEIPVESDDAYHPELWWYPFWLMRWPTGDNGTYTFSIKLYDSTGSELSLSTGISGNNSLTLYVDNTPPQAEISEIWQVGNSTQIDACAIINASPNQFYFKISAYDANQHMLSYHLTAYWGANKSEDQYTPGGIKSDSYSSHIGASPTYPWAGIINGLVRNTNPWEAHCNCAHTFYLGVWKRTIDGYNYILYRDYHKSITINNTGTSCN